MNDSAKMLIAALAAVLVIGIGVAALSGDDDDSSDTDTDTANTSQQESTNDATAQADAEQEPVASSNIVELAQATPSLSTLVDAVVAADLVTTLSGTGPFTVFAPTNDAFGTLLADLGVTAEQLLAREDLAEILTYHVVSGKVMAADLSDGQVVTTVQGGTLTVSVGDAGVTLTDANGNVSTVTSADIDASNGVVHVIDTVVLP